MAIDWDSAITGSAKAYNNMPDNNEESERGLLDRIFAPLGNYSVINGLYNLTDNDPNTGFLGGAADAVEYMNPFDSNVEEIHTTSDVLGNLGWNPESMPGKIARGVVGFAGDVLLDPLTYINPFSAGAKIVKGTGTVVKGAKGLEHVKGLTSKQAKLVVDTFYKTRNIDPNTLNPDDYLKEIKDLQTKYNEKILHIKKGGDNLQVGGANLPFANKIKVGDKTLDTFTKNLVGADKLREVGDATVAPYYNALANKVRNTKAIQKMSKYADLETLAKTNPMRASAILKLEDMIKGFDTTNINADLEAMDNANFINTLNDEEKDFIIDFVESGDFDAWQQMRGMVDKIKNQGAKLAKQADANAGNKDKLLKEQQAIKDRLTRLVGDIKQPKKSTIDNWGNEYYINRVLEYQPSAKLEVAEVSPDSIFDEMLQRGEFDDDTVNYAKQIYGKDVEKADLMSDELRQKRNSIIQEAKDALEQYGKKVPKEIEDDIRNRLNEVNKAVADNRDAEIRKRLIDLGRKDTGVIKALRSDFDANKELTKEYNAIGFTNESKKAVVDELNKALFGEKRKTPVVQYDIDDTLLENIMKAIETNDTTTAMKLLRDPVLQYNWDSRTFAEIYDRTNRSIDYSRYGLDNTYQLRGNPYIEKKNGDKKYFDVKDIPDIISKYEASGNSRYRELLERVAQELNVDVDGLKAVPRDFWSNYQHTYNTERRNLAELTGARDMRESSANRKMNKDALDAIRQESKNPNLDVLPGDDNAGLMQYLEDKGKLKDRMADEFDYRDIGKPIEDVLTDLNIENLNDMQYRIKQSLGGKQISQLEPEEFAVWRDINEVEVGKFGIQGNLITPISKRTIKTDDDIADEYIRFMKEKGKDTRYPDRNINKFDNILSQLKDDVTNTEPLEQTMFNKLQQISTHIENLTHVLNETPIGVPIDRRMITDELYKSVEMRKQIIEQYDALKNAKKVRAKLEAKIPVTQIERANFMKLSPFDQLKVADSYAKYQENRLLSIMTKSDNKKLSEMINDKRIKPEIRAEYEKFLNRRLASAERAKVAEAKKQEIIQNLKTRSEQIDAELGKIDSKNMKHSSMYYTSQAYRNDELAKQFGKSIEEVERLMNLKPDNKIIEATKMITDRFNKIAEKEIQLGKLKQEQYDVLKNKYIPHLLSDSGVKFFLEQTAKEHNGKFNPETFGVGIKKKFDQHRTLDTLKEFDDYMKSLGVEDGVLTDLADLFQARAIGHNELLFNEEMTNSIRTIFGKEYKAGTKLEGFSPTVTYNEIQKRLYDKHVATGGDPDKFEITDKMIEDMGLNPVLFSPNMQYIKVNDEQIKKIAQETSFTRPDGSGSKGLDIFNLQDELHGRLNHQSRIQKQMLQSDMLNLYDKFLYMFKMWNSAIVPGFHVQNAASNAFQSFMSQGHAILDPKRYKQAHEIYAGKNVDKTIDYKGHKISYKQIRTLAEKYGILDNTFFNEDIVIDVDPTGYLSGKGIPAKYDPTDLNNFIPYRKGKEWGANIEGTQRLVLFIKNLEDGKTVKDAVDDVNHFMFDYSDLTETEKEVMKRVIPFYTYMRKNVPLQLEQMLKNPWLYMYVNKGINNIEGMSGENEVPDSERSKWRQGYIQLPTQINGKPIGVNPQLPYQQLERLSPGRLLGQTTPLIKAPIELLSGEYAYTGIPIENGMEYLASQTIPTRMISQQADKEGTDKALYLGSQIIGFPMGTIERE